MKPVQIEYTNWRGERSRRTIMPERIVWGRAPPWHNEDQWLLVAIDLDKGAERYFAIDCIHDWTTIGEDNVTPTSVGSRR